MPHSSSPLPSPYTKTLTCLCVEEIKPKDGFIEDVGGLSAKITCDPAVLRATIDGKGYISSPPISTCTSFDISQSYLASDGNTTIRIDSDQFNYFDKDIVVNDTASIVYDGNTYNYIIVAVATNTSVFNIKYVSSSNDTVLAITDLCTSTTCELSIEICHMWDGFDWDYQLTLDEPAPPRFTRVRTFPLVAETVCTTEDLHFSPSCSHCDPLCVEAAEGEYIGTVGIHSETIFVGDTAKITIGYSLPTDSTTPTTPTTPTPPEVPTPGEPFPDHRFGPIYRDDSDYFYWSAEDFSEDFPDLVEAGPQYVTSEQQEYIELLVLGKPPGPLSMASVPGTDDSVLIYDVPVETRITPSDLYGETPDGLIPSVGDITPSDIYGDSPADIPPIFHDIDDLELTTDGPELTTDDIDLPGVDVEVATYNYIVTSVATSISGDTITIKYVSSTTGIDTPIDELCGNGADCSPLITFCHTTYTPDPLIEGVGFILAPLACSNVRVPATLTAVLSIDAKPTADYRVKQELMSLGELDPTYIDKYAGDFGDFECVQKLYPSGDLTIDAGMDSFVGPYKESDNLYSFIDEGIFTGDYDKPFGQSTLISDDQVSFIHPDTIHTEGLAQYKCTLTNFRVRPEETRFRIRASAPIENYESKISPRYTINEINFQDPSGNLIVQYDDIIIRGDAIYKGVTYVNYGTYSSNAKINKTTELYDWQRSLPLMHEVSGYTLSFNVKSEPLDDPFDEGYDEGYEENYIIPHETYASGSDYLALDGAPLSTQDQSFINPTRGLRISAVEICNSGGYGPRLENYTSLFLEVDKKGRRIERKILPTFMPLFDFDTGVYPSVSSIWYHNNNPVISNLDSCGSKEIVEGLRQDSAHEYATLHSVGPHLDSGKLTLKFSHSPSDINEISKGAFNCGFDQSTCETWWSPKQYHHYCSGAFNTQNRVPIGQDDGFFKIDSLTLKVKAKKAVDTRDYFLDVVGYSNDKLLNITRASGGFLQNPHSVKLNETTISSTGTIPIDSGFGHTDDLGISFEGISEKEQYFANSGHGDHHLLTQYPIVSGTEFQDYEVPLQIFDDNVTLGKSPDYSMSSLFEHLYLDIYPLPSGASIASAYLLVRYAPQNALKLLVEGGEKLGKIQDGRSEGKIFPISRQSNDDILNAGSGYNPLSTIEGIPHAYTTPSSIKSNYSRRWRGMEGTVQGPFDVEMYGFGFENPPVDFPFLSGYYDFDYIEGQYIKSRNLDYDGYTDDSVYDNFGQVSGLVSYEPEIFKNIGWRFSSDSLFNNALPGFTGQYKTTDWTSLSKGVSNFQSHELYGQIADAFNNVIRISGRDQSINFGQIDTTSGFSIFTRFTPDANISGATYNLFDSGVLFSKWNDPSDLDFALGYDDGYLCGYAQDIAGNIVTAKDTLKYSGYQFPLSVILTYNDHQNSGLKLYTDNELSVGEFKTLRASSSKFYKNETNADLILGYSVGSGVGMNMLVSEFGISTYMSGVKGSGTNIVESNSDPTHKQVTAQKFLENHRVKFWEPGQSYSLDTYKLWDYVNEDTHGDWTIGDFKYCEFSVAFDQVQKRPFTRDLISFNMKHDGSGYISRNDLTLPENIDSGVSYHTQIENDFLRFHLSDTVDNFYSTHRRITKDLPRGYLFKDRALVVETVIEHIASGNIVWPNCEETVGPKLIVSLYTTKQEPYWNPDEPNWGLINRDIHYLQPSSCLMRLDSKFTYDSLVDDSESWALFPHEPITRDFKERYFSQDVDDMFLQYDFVYPSGSSFESRINIHTAHVRLDDAYINLIEDSGVMNVFTSGMYRLEENLNLVFPYDHLNESGQLNLFTHGPSGLSDSGFYLYTSGQCRSYENLNLYALSYLTASGAINLNVSGHIPVYTSDALDLYIPVLQTVNASLPLTIVNLDKFTRPDPTYLNLFTYAVQDGATGIRMGMPTFLYNIHRADPTNSSGELSLRSLGSPALVNHYPFGAMNLFIDTPLDINESLNLTLYHDPSVAGTSESDIISDSGMPLYLSGYGGVGSEYFMWTDDNFGKSIEIEDNSYALVSVDNEIRGVDLIGYGSCTGNSQSKAIDRAFITDETIWRPETCNSGGIFRAKNTYTNLTTDGFGDTTGYSGNYYGIRKFTGLIPDNPYTSILKITTGSTEAIKVPRNFEDWEYGTCGPYFGASGCCTEDCDQNLAYSGVKLVGDYPFLSGDASITPPSGRMVGDKYGKSVSVDGDLMAVGSPFADIPDGSGYILPNAGTVFLYRREDDVAGTKADWQMADKLMLPSGYRRDYVTPTDDIIIDYKDFYINANKWNIGQEGRQFGHSVDVCSSGDRETVVIGAPHAAWTRQFTDVISSGIPIGILVFTDKFTNKEEEYVSLQDITNSYQNLYKYFSAPWNAATSYEFQPRIDIKVIVYEFAEQDDSRLTQSHSHGDWFRHLYLDRPDDSAFETIEKKQEVYDKMLDIVKTTFFEVFPSGQEAPHSGLPPILGIFQEHSNSAKNAFKRPNPGGGPRRHLVTDFSDFYKDFSYASGVIFPEVKDGVLTNNPKEAYINKVKRASDDWSSATHKMLDSTVSTGNLIDTNNLNFITSGVGQEWSSEIIPEIQIPPNSGGRIFVFEQESGLFNCVQAIQSKTDRTSLAQSYFSYGTEYHNRFGHAVSISKNSEVISVGSPYMTEGACEIFERNDSENQRMYGKIRDWLVSVSLTDEATRYDELLAASGATDAQITTYHELSHSNKFRLRIDESFWGEKNAIQLYKPIYDYSYGDIERTGTWGFILDEFLGTSRLGYSTSANDDGNTVVFGAPTDSTNLFEDTNVWYRGKESWASYTNAGAVRIFESRNYYPHSGVVEFTRFGNLDRSIHKEERDAGYYDQIGLYFGPNNPVGYKSFRRTKFSEIEIPRDAGLALIITPELDAASDEIISNIKDWLSLGDRTLVLVGNDPVYEEDGLYLKSNEILHKILKKLGSRMRIHPTKTKYESLQDCVSENDTYQNKYNVISAKVPENAHTSIHPSTISRDPIFAKGVGDIRIDLSDVELESLVQFMPCLEEDDPNTGPCSTPLQHNGDLRSQWIEICSTGPRNSIPYSMNWPFHFANDNPATRCEDYPESPRPLINKPYEDIVPVLTAAEFLPPVYWEQPEANGVNIIYIPIEEERLVVQGSKEFDRHQHNEIVFSVSGDLNFEIDGIYDEFSLGSPPFNDPDPVSFGDEQFRDGILQAEGTSYDSVEDKKEYWTTFSEDSTLAAQEKYFYEIDGVNTESNSHVILVASVAGENERSFGGESDKISGNNDGNYDFYLNMITPRCSKSADEDDMRLVQLGGWTGRTSFTDAYPLSVLKSKLTDFINRDPDKPYLTIDENVEYEAGDHIPANVDVVWIANPGGPNYSRPTNSEIGILKNWLQRDKPGKLIITYSARNDEAQDNAGNVDYICEQLGIESRPYALTYNPTPDPPVGPYYVNRGQFRTMIGDTKTLVEAANKEDYNININLCDNARYETEEDCEDAGEVWHGPIPTPEFPIQIVNPDVDSIKGCEYGFNFYPYADQENDSTRVFKVALWSYIYQSVTEFLPEYEDKYPDFYIPINVGANAEKIISYNEPIKEKYFVVPNRWQIDANTDIKFPVLPGSGYRMFINRVSEFESEKWEISAGISDVNLDPIAEDEIQNSITKRIALIQTSIRIPETEIIDFQAPWIEGDSTYIQINVNLNTDLWNRGAGGISLEDSPVVPYTPRLLSISGCLLPIEDVVESYTDTIIVGYEETEEPWHIPASSGYFDPEFRPIKGKSPFIIEEVGIGRTHCDTDNEHCEGRDEEIEDSAVIVAEEFEHFSSAANGYQRSKIVVISDSTIIQGQCPHYRRDALNENQEFIRSLYPTSPHERSSSQLGFTFSSQSTGGRQFNFTQKIRSPERGSPAKYFAVSGIPGTTEMFGLDGVYGNLSNYIDGEDLFDPSDSGWLPSYVREKNPKTEEERELAIENFDTGTYGVYPRYSGDFLDIGSYTIDGVTSDVLLDARAGGGLPDLMKFNNTDYLDFDIYNSGCPGDLFGYSVDLTQNKLIVGTPFNAFHIEDSISGVSGLVPWASISGDNNPHRSGMKISANGGAGAAFYFERTGSGSNVVSEYLPWEFKQKIKPSSVNVGMDNASIADLQLHRGDHDLDSNYIKEYAQRTDQFGYSVAIDSDMIAVGAPNHDFETLHYHIYSGGSAFQRKSFNPEFTIPGHEFYDLGGSGVRYDQFGGTSGDMVLNNGAVFNYRHEMIDWPNRIKEWKYAEKLYPQGYADRTKTKHTGDRVIEVSGCENDSFGQSVAMSRAKRGDSDYTLVVGSPNHDFRVSGEYVPPSAFTGLASGMADAGAAYTFDAMLREQIPAIPNIGSFIDVEIFGERPTDVEAKLTNRVYQNVTGESITYTTSGTVFSNKNGDIFIEASGFDPASKGFIAHRPFVESVVGITQRGTPSSGSFNLLTFGKPVQIDNAWSHLESGKPYDLSYSSSFINTGLRPSGLSLMIAVPGSAIVYNNMGLYTPACLGLDSGSLPLRVAVASGIISSGLNLLVSSNTIIEQLNLKVRGI